MTEQGPARQLDAGGRALCCRGLLGGRSTTVAPRSRRRTPWADHHGALVLAGAAPAEPAHGVVLPVSLLTA